MGREDVEVGVEGDVVEEGMLFVGGVEVEGFGGGGYEDCGVVVEDVGEDYDYGDGEEDLVVVVRVVWLVILLMVVKDSGRGVIYNNWGFLWIVWIGICVMVVVFL